MTKYCKNCGSLIDENSKYCGECGKPTKEPQKNSNLIIALGVIIVLALVGVGAFIAIDPLSEFEQEITVGNHIFTIPSEFELDESSLSHESEGGITTDIADYTSDDAIISIFVITDPANSNLKELVEDTSRKEEHMGHNGYVEEDESGYYFTFRAGHDICTVFTNDETLLDCITCD